MASPSSPVAVLVPRAGESWDMLLSRVEREKKEGKVLLCLPPKDAELAGDSSLREKILKKLAEKKGDLILAAKHPVVVADARAKGITVVDRLRQLRTLLKDHPQLDDVVRVFSPHYWRQELKTRLQRMGLLALPTLRIYLLAGVSVLLFLFVLFRLLPSATVYVWPREEPVTQTINVFLTNSGAVATLPPKVQKLDLESIRVELHQSLVFSDISKQFIGTSAKLPMTVVNKTTDVQSLRKGTRFVNQAGMVFLIDNAVIIPAGSQTTVSATAADKDIYQKIIGDRGNVPAGLQWQIPGLSDDLRPQIYGLNQQAGKGGTTAYRTVLQKEDLQIAQKRLEQQLLAAAKQETERQRLQWNKEHPNQDLELLTFDELTHVFYEDFNLPNDQVGQTVTSVTMSGGIAFRMYGYDRKRLLDLLSQELLSHVQDSKEVEQDSLSSDHLDVRVIAYDDGLAWIKITVELTGTQQYILDPLSVDGALFAKRVREAVASKNKDEALRILRNLPEVDRVQISIWPPWAQSLPAIPASITVTPQSPAS